MNERKQKEKQINQNLTKKECIVQLQLPKSINALNRSQNSMKSITLVNSLENIMPDFIINSPQSSQPFIQMQNSSSQNSISELSPSDRINYYTSQLKRNKEEYEQQIKQGIQKIKIVRMKEEKERLSKLQSPIVKHDRVFVIRKSPEEFQKQRFLLPADSESLKVNTANSQQKSQQKAQLIRYHDKMQIRPKSKELIQKEKELEELVKKEYGWKYSRSRLELFSEESKQQSLSPNARLSQNHLYLSFPKRNSSNPLLEWKEKQAMKNQDRPNTAATQQNSLLNSILFSQTCNVKNFYNPNGGISNNGAVRSILKSKNKECIKQPHIENTTIQDLSSIHSEQNDSFPKRVSFLRSKNVNPKLF